MNDEQKLIEKLKLIEALFAGTDHAGEKNAAELAAERIRKKLAEMQVDEKPVEYKVLLRDYWSRKLFVALLRRYNLTPYRLYRQRYTTVMVKVPPKFLEEILFPEFKKLSKVLVEYLEGVTDKVITESIYPDIKDAEEIEGSLILHNQNEQIV